MVAEEQRGNLVAAAAAAGDDVWRGVVAAVAGDATEAACRLRAGLDGDPDDDAAATARPLLAVADRLRWDVLPGGAALPTAHLQLLRARSPAPAEPDGWLSRLLLDRGQLDLARWSDRRTAGLLTSAVARVRASAPEPFATLAAADLHCRAGDRDGANRLIAQALAAYEAARDLAGAGACHLVAGDLLAAPFASPLTADLDLLETWTGDDEPRPTAAAAARAPDPDPEAAHAHYNRAAARFAEAGAPRGRAAVQLRLGFLAFIEHDHLDAADRAAAAARGFQAAGDSAGAQLATAHRALWDVAAGRLPEDDDAAAAIGAWGAAAGSPALALGIGLLCGRIGRSWLVDEADPERAAACHRLARAVFAALGAELNVAHALAAEAGAHTAVGDLDTAHECYNAAAAAFHRAGDLSGLPDATVTALRIARTAIPFHRNAIFAARRQAAVMKRHLPRLEAAVRELEQDAGVDASTLARRRALTVDARVLALAFEAGGARERREAYEDLLTAAKQAACAGPEPHRLEALVLTYATQARAGARDAYLRHLAETASEPPTDERLRDELTTCALVGAWPEAAERWKCLAERHGEDWWARDREPWLRLDELAGTREAAGDLLTALELRERAIALLERRRARILRPEDRLAQLEAPAVARLFAGAARTALDAAKEAEEAGRTREAEALEARAFDVAQRGRGRALLDLMQRAAVRAGEPEAARREARAWRRRAGAAAFRRELLAAARARHDTAAVAQLKPSLRRCEEALEAAEESLRDVAPDWIERVNPTAEPPTLADLTERLPPDRLVIECLIEGDELILWAITRDGIVDVKRMRANAWWFGQRVRTFRVACSVSGTEPERFGDLLSEMLLEPFGDLLDDGFDRVVFVPHGQTHELPFHALPWRDRKPLGATHVVSVLPSAAALRYGRSPDTPVAGPLLAVGNPSGMRYRRFGERAAEDLRPLPWAGAEAALAAQAFPGSDLVPPDEATRTHVKSALRQHRLVLLATHGVLHETPLLSSLLLADGEALTMHELLSLDLQADLVVLSACESGVHEVGGGDEILAFTRGLLAAGARAAIVTLWKIRDSSTALLMDALFTRLAAGSPPVDALHHAQCHVRGLDTAAADAALQDIAARALAQGVALPERTPPLLGPPDLSHPKHWAPFVYVGI